MMAILYTYSMYHGQTVSEIVTGKPVDCGGTVGRCEATGRGVAYLISRVMDLFKINANSTTAIIQGYGNSAQSRRLRLPSAQFFWDEAEVLDRLDRVLERSFQKVLQRAQKDRISYRNAALAIRVETVRQSKITRGLFP